MSKTKHGLLLRIMTITSVILSSLLILTGCSSNEHPATTASSATPSPLNTSLSMPAGLEKIQHFVFIVQENRSFDSYFGTYPGADGIPQGIALKDPVDGTMVTPYHNTAFLDFNGPHDWSNAMADIDGGKMDGFLNQAYTTLALTVTPSGTDPTSNPKGVMAYHNYHEIPNYWDYAELYVLQDHMFESAAAYSLVSHLYILAAQSGGYYDSHTQPKPTTYNFPEITEFLADSNISWNYYVTSGQEPDSTGAAIGSAQAQANDPDKYTLWNPLPAFPAVQNNLSQRIRLVDTAQFYSDAAKGTLPDVSWICPDFKNPISEHPQFKGDLRDGMAYVTGLINAVMEGPDWNSTAIFVAWDDWGGFYDNVVPPSVDQYGYGLRVPGLIISPYVKENYVDHQTYSFDSWLRLIEERFGIPPMTSRESIAGDMTAAFDFTQQPRAPIILSPTVEGSPYPQPLQVIEH